MTFLSRPLIPPSYYSPSFLPHTYSTKNGSQRAHELVPTPPVRKGRINGLHTGPGSHQQGRSCSMVGAIGPRPP